MLDYKWPNVAISDCNAAAVINDTCASLAYKYLCSPPSTVESERLFSIGGNIYTPHRNRLSPDYGQKLMFLNYNLRLLDCSIEE